MELFFCKLWDGSHAWNNFQYKKLQFMLTLKRFSASSIEEDIKFGVPDPKMPFLFHSSPSFYSFHSYCHI